VRRGLIPKSTPPRVTLALVVSFLVLTLGSCTGSAPRGPGGGKPRSPTDHPSPAVSAPPPASETISPPAGTPRTDLAGRLAFSADDDVYSMDADGTHLRRLTTRIGPEFDPSWSPDGSRIVYRDSRRGINDNDELYVMNADGTNRHALWRAPSNEWGPAWSPDGRLIAFSSTRDGPPQLFVIRPDGSGLRKILDVEAEYPAWSPDGSRIAFMGQEPGAHGPDPNYDIFVVGLDGSGLRRLTDYGGEDGLPRWSPDGRSIAYQTTRDDTGGLAGAAGPYTDVYLMDSDGSNPHRLTSLFSYTPSFSPDGRFVLVSATGLPPTRFRLYVVDLHTGEISRIPTPAGLGGALDVDWTA
jgi:Tol biopolymer transport system component